MAALQCACAVAVAAAPGGGARRLAGARPLGLPRTLLRKSPSLGLCSGMAANAGSEERRRFVRPVVRAAVPESRESRVDDDFRVGVEDGGGFYEKAFLAAAVALAPLIDVQAASAMGGEFGIFEGRTISLIHPIVMGSLLVYTLYAGYLGWQWRRVRTIQTDITELKKQVKPVAVAAGEKSSSEPPPSPVEAQINSLNQERKELVKGGYREKHFNAGSILLGLGVFSSVAGPVNTWFRTGKLFPGPHLFAGAGITVCWALAASCVPAMQKGSETARNLHIGLNLINVLLFIWQIPTGWEIVQKVLELAPLP